jgi:hypothetical protein
LSLKVGRNGAAPGGTGETDPAATTGQLTLRTASTGAGNRRLPRAPPLSYRASGTRHPPATAPSRTTRKFAPLAGAARAKIAAIVLSASIRPHTFALIPAMQFGALIEQREDGTCIVGGAFAEKLSADDLQV